MGGLTNRSRTRMEHEDRSREPSVRRAPSRFVRRPDNPECGFARRPTFLFLPRSFGLLLVALSAFSPPFLGQESRKESGRCMHSDVVVDSGHELACLSLFFSLSPHPLAYQLASPRCSVRDIKSNFPSPLPPRETSNVLLFLTREKRGNFIPSITELAEFDGGGVRTRRDYYHLSTIPPGYRNETIRQIRVRI